MTREEAIEMLKKDKQQRGDCFISEAIDVAIKALEQESRWIPVSERLPEVADCYTVTRQVGSDSIVGACYFDGIDTWHDDKWINHERNYLTDIVAWMPLPKPYEPQESEDKTV